MMPVGISKVMVWENYLPDSGPPAVKDSEANRTVGRITLCRLLAAAGYSGSNIDISKKKRCGSNAFVSQDPKCVGGVRPANSDHCIRVSKNILEEEERSGSCVSLLEQLIGWEAHLKLIRRTLHSRRSALRLFI